MFGVATVLQDTRAVEHPHSCSYDPTLVVPVTYNDESRGVHTPVHGAILAHRTWILWFCGVGHYPTVSALEL